MQTKLTVRVSHKLIEKAKRYASAHNVTLTDLVSAYLESIPNELESIQNAPIVQQLTGVLSPDISIEDYKKYLDQKYGG